MPTIVPRDRLWFQVLRAYRLLGGTGLSPTAVCALTGMPWPKLKREFEAVWDLQRGTGEPKRYLATTHCYAVQAFLLIAFDRPLQGVVPDILYWDRLDEQTVKWPAPQYKSVSKHQGRVRLHTYNSKYVIPVLRSVVAEFKKTHGHDAY